MLYNLKKVYMIKYLNFNKQLLNWLAATTSLEMSQNSGSPIQRALARAGFRPTDDLLNQKFEAQVPRCQSAEIQVTILSIFNIP